MGFLTNLSSFLKKFGSVTQNSFKHFTLLLVNTPRGIIPQYTLKLRSLYYTNLFKLTNSKTTTLLGSDYVANKRPTQTYNLKGLSTYGTNITLILHRVFHGVVFFWKSLYRTSFSFGWYYLQGLVFVMFIDACLTDDEPLWEPIEWSLVQTWILFIFLFG